MTNYDTQVDYFTTVYHIDGSETLEHDFNLREWSTRIMDLMTDLAADKIAGFYAEKKGD